MPDFDPSVIVADPGSLRSLVETLRRVPRAAVDTESNSLHAYRERVCLLQISTTEIDYLLDPLALPDLSALSAFFEDPRLEKVFHAAEYDLLCLRRDFSFHVRGLFDTHAAARSLGIKEFGLSPLLDCEFGVQLDKHMQRADWGKRPLPERQLDYARFDTHYLLALRDRLAAKIDAIGCWEELREEFLRLEQIPDQTQEETASDPFWRIRGINELSPTQRATLEALYRWREQRAERIDRPPFHILSEEAMVSLAKIAPSSEKELARAALGQRVRDRWGKEILQTIRNSRTQKPPFPPKISRLDEHTQVRLENLRKWRKRRAETRGVESDVIISRDLLFRIARHAPTTLEALAAIPGLGPWRLNTYGAEILAVLNLAKS